MTIKADAVGASKQTPEDSHCLGVDNFIYSSQEEYSSYLRPMADKRLRLLETCWRFESFAGMDSMQQFLDLRCVWMP